MIRGLIERIPNKNDMRAFLYQPTFALLGHLGIKRMEDLPEWATVKKEIEMFELANKESAEGDDSNLKNVSAED